MGYTHGRHLKGFKRSTASFQKQLLASAADVSRAVQQVFIGGVNNFLDYVQNNKDLLPYDTGNLHDSIVGVISQSGRVVRAMYMPREAVRPQHMSSGRNDSLSQHAPDRKRIIGMEEAIKAVRRQDYPRNGVASTLIVAVPYAQGVNVTSHHPGYLEWLSESFMSEMRASLDILNYIRVNPGAKPVISSNRRFK